MINVEQFFHPLLSLTEAIINRTVTLKGPVSYACSFIYLFQNIGVLGDSALEFKSDLVFGFEIVTVWLGDAEIIMLLQYFVRSAPVESTGGTLDSPWLPVWTRKCALRAESIAN